MLSALQGDLNHTAAFNTFVVDFGAYGRFLLAAPLLVLAEVYCVPRLTALARQFLAAGLVTESDRARYEFALRSTRSLLNSTTVTIAVYVSAYVLVIAAFFATSAIDLPLWHGARNGGTFRLSPAGWRGILVSLPVLLVLLLGWLWRVCLWTRFLWLMSRLELRLLPVHPDHYAGLGFIGSACEAFLPLAVVVGIIAAGPVTNQVVHHGASVLRFKPLMAGMAVMVVALFAGPSLVFARRLRGKRERARLSCGAFALREGEPFRRTSLTMGGGGQWGRAGPRAVFSNECPVLHRFKSQRRTPCAG